MRRLEHQTNSTSMLSPTPGITGVRSITSLAAKLTIGRETFSSPCLRCYDEPCISYSHTEIAAFSAASEVCPVNAIRLAKSPTGPSISDSCIGCGLCAMRCTTGSIAIGASSVEKQLEVTPPMDGSNYFLEEADSTEFTTSKEMLRSRISWEQGGVDLLANELAAATLTLRQQSFYPLVASLFSYSGFPVWKPAQGDTNNRVDLILVDADDSIPIEVKSATEVTFINAKSIQQALENKIIMDERSDFRTIRDSFSLVVGYDYPPVRSPVAEMVSNIRDVYGIRISMISIRDLYKMAIHSMQANEKFERSMLADIASHL